MLATNDNASARLERAIYTPSDLGDLSSFLACKADAAEATAETNAAVFDEYAGRAIAYRYAASLVRQLVELQS